MYLCYPWCENKKTKYKHAYALSISGKICRKLVTVALGEINWVVKDQSGGKNLSLALLEF